MLDLKVSPNLVSNNGPKVLVLCATGKVGRNVTLALHSKGFDVYGTTRSQKQGNKLESKGIKPVICNYVVRKDLDDAFKSTGAKLAFIITDYFLAAGNNMQKEIEQGKMMVDACKAAGCEFVIFSSVCDLEYFSDKVKHIKAKLPIEEYLKSSGLKCGIVRPVAFFENFDDPINYNPLKKGSLKFLSICKVKFCATYDIGLACAVMFNNQSQWNMKSLDICSWEGDLNDASKALENVSGIKTTGSLAMPICLRSLFLSDLHHMCLYFENEGGFKGSIVEFKKVVPEAMSAEDWFCFQGVYSNGEKFVK